MARARLTLLALVWCATAWGQTDRLPRIGYVYPAGGRVGSTVAVTVGGQNLRPVSRVFVSGRGVAANLIEYVKPLSNQDIGNASRYIGQRSAYLRAKDKPNAPQPPEKPELPDHPLLRNIDDKTIDELSELRATLNDPKKQPNAQIADTLRVNVTIAADAEPGDHELRVESPVGLSSPLCFQVSTVPEVAETDSPTGKALTIPVVDLPVVLNGQVMPGDVDHFFFRARWGQRVVVRAYARKLIPYLADAVPGWFQATLALYDGNRAEVAFADDYGFEPDPVVFFMIPKDGVYEIEIRDSIYRGREDFVYRVAVGEMPFITSIYPLGAREGERATVNLTGWNILDRRLSLDTSPGESIIRYATLSRNKLCNRVPYAVDTLPEADEAEANDRPNDAQKIDLPVTINGRIYKPGDVDWFEFKGQAGQEVVAEVYAHRLNSMLDSLLRLTDAEGKVVAWNDDYDNKEMGLQTRHADSYLSAKLPAAGVYRIQLADATRHGSDYHAYRLRVSAPRPDFGLRLMPSGATVPAGRVLPITVYAFRRDGFAGDIEVSLDESASGFHLSGGRIPAGVESIRMTLTAPPKDLDQPASLKLVGRASVAGRTVSRQVVPADDMMQAFIYHHLVPRDELAISVTKARFIAPAGQVASAKPLEIPRGGQATAKVVTGQKPNLTGISFSLNQPPQGISLGKVTPAADGLEFELKADAKAAELGRADNLIIEVFSVNQGRRYSISMVPAIPIQVVGQ